MTPTSKIEILSAAGTRKAVITTWSNGSILAHHYRLKDEEWINPRSVGGFNGMEEAKSVATKKINSLPA